MAEFAVDGFEITELLGFGPTGEVFTARDLRSGDPVALKRLRPEAMAVVERLRRDAAIVAAVGAGHVANVRDVLVTASDVVLVMDVAAGGNLAALLERRGPLPPGEAVTLLAPIAGVLARLHAQQCVHGDVLPANVLLAADGRPLLADFGVALAMDTDLTAIDGSADYLDPAVLRGARTTSTSDVYSLGAVGFAVLAGRPPRIGNDRLARFCPDAPPALIAAIESAIGEDSLRRPDAAAFGEALIRACPAAPVGVNELRTIGVVRPAAAPPPVRRPAAAPPKRTGRLNVPAANATPRASSRPPASATARRSRPMLRSDSSRHRLPPRGRLAVAGIFAFGLAVVAGLGWGRLHPPTAPLQPPPSSGRTAAPADFATGSPAAPTTSLAAWRGIVGYLEATRAQAFATGRPSLLRSVYSPTAPGLAVDQASVRSLAGRGLHAVGFTATVERVTVDSASATVATLQVVDRLASYRLVDSSGATVDTGAGRPARAFTMRLVRTPAGWRVSSVVP